MIVKFKREETVLISLTKESASIIDCIAKIEKVNYTEAYKIAIINGIPLTYEDNEVVESEEESNFEVITI